MAFVGWVIKTRPLKFVFARTYGKDAAWSMWKLRLVSWNPLMASGYLEMILATGDSGQDGITRTNSKGVRQGKRANCIVLIWHTKSKVVDVVITRARYRPRQHNAIRGGSVPSVLSHHITSKHRVVPRPVQPMYIVAGGGKRGSLTG